MAIKIEIPESREALTEFVRFYDQVYVYRDARWQAPLELQLPVLTGDSPFAQGREIRPFLALKDAESLHAPLPSWTSITSAIGMSTSDISSCLKRCRIAAQRPSFS